MLPTNKIEEGLAYIEEVIEEKWTGNKKVSKKWKKFFYYLNSFWMKRVTPKIFSVYMIPDRTNNFLESYHNVFGSIFNTHPGVETLIRK